MIWEYNGQTTTHIVGDAILTVKANPNATPLNYSRGAIIHLQKGFLYEWKEGQPSDEQLIFDGFIKKDVKKEVKNVTLD